MIMDEGGREPEVNAVDPGAPEVPGTDDEGLNEMMRELARASAISLEDQLPVIEAVHRTLQNRLADVEG
ncbi:MAG: hypothetical protein IPG94_22795 [Kineosporiaceae bacterium]|nr:hypothetical protein [Kineosporiaceae bacterium]